jgi:tripeptide aminopeptidase
MTMNTTEKFLRYISTDTTSSEDSGEHPSTSGQFDLARILVMELLKMGIPRDDLYFDEDHCYIYAKIKANTPAVLPAIGFIAHMDTSLEASGKDVRAQFVFDYDGDDIELRAGNVLSPDVFPELLAYKGMTLITSDGTTLLGADDKAGIAEIMAMADYFLENPDVEHGDICIAFTPDEEIGEGTEFFDIERFGADFAYTVDGGALGEISYENFNAASASIRIEGCNVHPGEAKDKMVSAIRLAMKIDGSVPDSERPETTSDREGFFHLCSMEGDVSSAVMKYIIRDHDREKFEEKKDRIRKICDAVASEHPACRIECEVKDTYYNMYEKMYPDNMHIVKRATDAMERLGIKPDISPVRGGTDGAMLSFKGLPCPNICAGGHNFHGVYEYICVESMDKIADLLVQIVIGDIG